MGRRWRRSSRIVTTFIASAVINSSGSDPLGFAVALGSGLLLGAVIEPVLAGTPATPSGPSI